MAVISVENQEKKDDSLQKIGAVGGLISMIPTPYTRAIGGVMQGAAVLGSMAQKPGYKPVQPQMIAAENIEMPDRSQALQRRQELNSSDPYQSLVDAREALAKLDIDPDLKNRLSIPIDTALNAQRRV